MVLGQPGLPRGLVRKAQHGKVVSRHAVSQQRPTARATRADLEGGARGLAQRAGGLGSGTARVLSVVASQQMI